MLWILSHSNPYIKRLELGSCVFKQEEKVVMGVTLGQGKYSVSLCILILSLVCCSGPAERVA